MLSPVAKLRLQDLSEEQEFTLQLNVTDRDIDQFAVLSGDISPLHMSAAFAQARGFEGRVVHGALMLSYISRIVGVHFPGENCLLQSVNMKFLAPAYAGDTILLKTVIDQLSEATHSLILAAEIQNVANAKILAKGKIHIGLTR